MTANKPSSVCDGPNHNNTSTSIPNIMYTHSQEVIIHSQSEQTTATHPNNTRTNEGQLVDQTNEFYLPNDSLCSLLRARVPEPADMGILDHISGLQNDEEDPPTGETMLLYTTSILECALALLGKHDDDDGT